MPSRKSPVRLSGPEISLVRMLWEQGDVTLCEAHRAMRARGEKIGYTTVQTRLERLVGKSVVAKTTDRPAKYAAAVSPEEVSRPILDLLLDRVSGPVPLVAHLLQDPSLKPEDLAEIKRLIAEAEQSRKPCQRDQAFRRSVSSLARRERKP